MCPEGRSDVMGFGEVSALERTPNEAGFMRGIPPVALVQRLSLPHLGAVGPQGRVPPGGRGAYRALKKEK